MPETWTQTFDTGGMIKKYLLTKLSSKILKFRVTDTNRIIIKSWWYLKHSFDDADADALISKEISQTQSNDGVITPASGSSNTALSFLVTDQDIDSISTGDYVACVKSMFDDGSVSTHTNTMTRVRVIPWAIQKHKTGIQTASGSARIQFGSSASGYIVGQVQGTSRISVSSVAHGSRVVKGSGSARIGLVSAATGSVVGEVLGSASVRFSGSATAKRTVKAGGRSLIQIYSPNGVQGKRTVFGSGSSAITVSTAADGINTNNIPTFPKWGSSYGWSNQGEVPTQTELNDFFAFNTPMIRCDLSWGVVEKTLGNYTWTTPDQVLRDMTAQGIKVLFTFDYNNTLYGVGQQDGITTSANRTAYVNFVKEAIKRYKGQVACWEIWNEPNEPKFWGPDTATPNPADYLSLIKAVYPAIKQISPSEYVINGGISGFDWPYISALINGGILNYVDGFAVHPYRAYFEPETVAADWITLQNLITPNLPAGKSVDLFCSEWGYSTYNNNGDLAPSSYQITTSSPGGNNRVIWSNSLTNSAWTRITSNLTTGVSDPVGGHNATRISQQSLGSAFGVSQNGGLTAGSFYNVSCWIRATSGQVQIKVGLGTGVLGDVFLADTTWKRVSTLIYYDGSVTSTKIFRLGTQDKANTTAIEIYGPQTELLSLTQAQWLGYQEQRQASWRKRAIQANVASGVKCSIDFNYKDSSTAKTALDQHFGCITSTGVHKASYGVLQGFRP